MNRQNANFQIKNLVTTAMLMAIGLILPFFTGQIPQIGSMLLPMHIPVFICGFVCGWPYGGVMGFFLPLVRHVAFGMPPVLSAVAMAFELAAYGMICGFLYNRSHWKCIVALYRSLIAAMIGGRIVWGLVYALIGNVFGGGVSWGYSRYCCTADIHSIFDGGIESNGYFTSLSGAKTRQNLIPCYDMDGIRTMRLPEQRLADDFF